MDKMAITNFEEITKELTDYENEILYPFVLKLVLKSTEKTPITNGMICKLGQAQGIKIHGTRVRKVVHEIRLREEFFLCATSKGYFITNNDDKKISYLTSLRERMNSINEVYNALRSK